MCLIGVKNTGVHKKSKISEELFMRSITVNPDGMGVMYIGEDERVIVEKALKREDMIKLYHKVKDFPFFAYHVRIKTHGVISEENCHPYQILSKEEDGEDMWLMHNGILRGTKATFNSQRSDTFHFVEDELKSVLKRDPRILDDPGYMATLSNRISGSKFVVLSGKGSYWIVNESDGVTKDHSWLSNGNSSYTPPVYNYTSKHGYNNWQGQHDDWKDTEWDPVTKTYKKIEKPASCAVVTSTKSPTERVYTGGGFVKDKESAFTKTTKSLIDYVNPQYSKEGTSSKEDKKEDTTTSKTESSVLDKVESDKDTTQYLKELGHLSAKDFEEDDEEDDVDQEKLTSVLSAADIEEVAILCKGMNIETVEELVLADTDTAAMLIHYLLNPDAAEYVTDLAEELKTQAETTSTTNEETKSLTSKEVAA
jgi:hypothetical protein